MSIFTKMTDERPNVYSDEVNKSRGQTVDSESFLNNYAIEPEIYQEDCSLGLEMVSKVTVVDIFDSEASAKAAVLAIEAQGLAVRNISIVAKGYKEPQHSLSWSSIVAEGGLELMLTKLGIDSSAIPKFIEAIEQGKFLVIEIGSDRDASQAQQVLGEVGHAMLMTP